MKLSREGFLYKYYWWAYKEWPPNNLCPFFWKTTIALLLFPLIWLSHPFRVNSIWERVGYSLFSLLVLIGVGTITGFALSGFYEPIVVLGLMTVILLIIAISIGVIMFIAAGVCTGTEAIFNSEIVKVIKERKRGFMENYCPKIDWS